MLKRCGTFERLVHAFNDIYRWRALLGEFSRFVASFNSGGHHMNSQTLAIFTQCSLCLSSSSSSAAVPVCFTFSPFVTESLLNLTTTLLLTTLSFTFYLLNVVNYKTFLKKSVNLLQQNRLLNFCRELFWIGRNKGLLNILFYCCIR